jgi:hypothetical protein
VNNTSSGHIYITGNVTCPAGNVYQGFAVYNTGTGNVYITGNVTGTGSFAAVQNSSTGRVYVTGNVAGGSSGINAVGVQNQSTGIVVVNGTITGGTNGSGYVGIVAGSLLCHTGDRVTGSGAINAVGGIGLVRIAASQQTTFSLMTYDTSTLTEAASRSLYTGGVNLNQPAVANVRSGTTFGASSEYTGTLAVPSPTLVAIGVATDNTVGSYAPTGGLDAAGVRTAIGLATANLDTQLSGIQSDTNDIQTRLPAALESGRIAAALDSATETKINKIEAAVAGTVTGAGTSTEVFVGPSATLTITVDSSGNRSAVVVT